MELMEISLDGLYKLVYVTLKQSIPEDILGIVALAVSIVMSFDSLELTLNSG